MIASKGKLIVAGVILVVLVLMAASSANPEKSGEALGELLAWTAIAGTFGYIFFRRAR